MNLLSKLPFPFRLKVRAQSPISRRFLSNRAAIDSNRFLEAARELVARKPEGEVSWLYCKPYDCDPGNPTFYTELYQVLNLLQAMAIRPYGRVLEIGCGPGWVTEILALLGFRVDAIEPSRDMITIAERRVSCSFECYKVKNAPHVLFHETTLEDCSLPDATFDAVVFHEALHHIVEEEKGLAQSFRLLRAGGVLGISEWAWIPGDRELEEQLEKEIASYGTLESPFTQEYLDLILTKNGFVDIQRYHSVNGFFRSEDGNRSIEEVAQPPARVANNLTARKPGDLTTADFSKKTLAVISVQECQISGKSLKAVVTLRNTGDTVWLAGGDCPGCVNVALRSGNPDDPDFLEAHPRQPLPSPVRPGQLVNLTLNYDLPNGATDRQWEIDLVNERLFWFSKRGTVSCVVLPAQT